jgi:predicted DNA-binding transcriptional regulator AlpA
MKTTIERHLRVEEFARLCGYSIATIRKKIARREIGFRSAAELSRSQNRK